MKAYIIRQTSTDSDTFIKSRLQDVIWYSHTLETFVIITLASLLIKRNYRKYM